MKHVKVYQGKGRYAGWPANYGMWHWGNEIVVGFTVGYHQSDEHFHARAKSKPFMNQQARSLDGGQTWELEAFSGTTPDNRGLSSDEHMQYDLGIESALEQNDIIRPVSEPINFSHPNFALMCARTGLKKGARSFFYISYDRCKQWQGPYSLPMFDQSAIAARTDYLIEDHNTCLFFLTANKTYGSEGKVICVRTSNGGQSFEFVSDIGGEPKGELDFKIMPSSLRLAEGQLLSSIRSRGKDDKDAIRNWIDLYSSDDNA